jgi:PncC family amidohydrolase
MQPPSLEIQVGELLRQFGMRLVTAESCTGGLIGHLLTNVPGSSDYYLGGVIAYDNQVKMRQLGVRPKTLEQHGAVSRETVLEMARGARELLGADIALAVSGIAGPGGSSLEKPVGTVWIGLSASAYEVAWLHHFDGNRLKIKMNSAQQALLHLIEYLNINT